MTIEHVAGKNKGDVLLYALSTCVWCKKTKKLLNDLGVEYRYIFVDLLSEEEMQTVEKDLARWNPDRSFPTLVIDNSSCIIGYKPDELKKRFGV